MKYGQRVQNSVFECILDSAQYVMVKEELSSLIEYNSDSLRLIILKPNKKVRQVEKIENNNRAQKNKSKQFNDNNYIVKEAELLISKYILRIEEKREQKQIYNKKINEKYKRIKKYSYISSIIILIESIILFIK